MWPCDAGSRPASDKQTNTCGIVRAILGSCVAHRALPKAVEGGLTVEPGPDTFFLKQRMAKHGYPRDLRAILRRRWNGESMTDGWPRVDLPEKAVLDELLDVCYHASLMTEEGRPTIFRVAFVSGSTPVSPPRREPVLLEPTMRYVLGEPVPFTVGELRRLAPVADPRRVLIAVEQIGEGVSGRRLQIYGLIDVGVSLWEMARHERISGTASPDVLVVASTRPGELSISRGDHPVARLRGGELVRPTGSVLFHGPVARFFLNASDALIREACGRSGVNQDPAEDDGLSFAHLWFIESILVHTAGLKHGGALLFVQDALADNEVRLQEVVSVKYRLPSTRSRDALVAAMAVRLEHNELHGRLRGRRAVKQEDLENLEALAWHQRDLEESSRDAARFIGSLTAVDGAVVLTDMLRIIGFGAEVRVNRAGVNAIHIAKNEEGDGITAVPFTDYGTRHRSAFRFVGNMTPSVAFILSQDGGIKAATKVGERVVMWPYFEVGYSTALS